MGLFDYIKKILKDISKTEDVAKVKSNNKKDEACVSNKYPPISVNNLDKYTILYLTSLNGKKQNELLPDYWENVLITKDYTDKFLKDGLWENISKRKIHKEKFLKDGLLIIAPIEERLQYCTVVELKNILRKNNLKVSGKKDELIDRILSNIDKEQIGLLIDSDVCILSDVGVSIVERYEDIKTKYHSEYISNMYTFIKNEDYEKALNEAMEYSNSIKISFYDNDNDYNTTENSNVSYSDRLQEIIMEINILTLDDLDNSDDFKTIFKLALKYSYLSNNGHFCKDDVIDFLNKFSNESLKSNKLEIFLKENDIYLATISRYKDSDSIYLYTIGSIIRNNIYLREIKTDTSNRSYIKGIEILHPNNEDDSCEICKNHNLKVSWKELHKLPELPAHYGCRCSYTAWMKGDEN